MKFTFEVIESSSIRHTVEAESLMEAESKIQKAHWSGKLDIEKYGVRDSEIKLIKIDSEIKLINIMND